MLNESARVLTDEEKRVIEGVTLDGRVNVDDDTLLANITAALRRGHPQIRPFPPKHDRVVLVGGGPSLADTEDELRQLLLDGALLVTVNGAYHWCLARNYRPNTQIVMDARASNARFVEPAIPRCRYVLASQCHPATWDAVEGRDNVWIFHAAAGAEETRIKHAIETYYHGQWVGVGGGTTVTTRALSLLRTLGYLRFDLFGVDSCWLNGANHAYSQVENLHDRRVEVEVSLGGHPETARTFTCSPWHLKQAEDFAQMVKVNSDHFVLNVHGDGLLAYMLKTSADVTLVTAAEAES